MGVPINGTGKAKIIGRNRELALFQGLVKNQKPKLVCIYGRRRVGKSFLIENAIDAKSLLRFEGIEGEHTDVQIKQFLNSLSEQTGDKLLAKARSADWAEVFDKLTEVLKARQHLKQTKTVVFLDEFQWMAAQNNLLVALFKKYWDQHWSKLNVMFILCGSISSFMVKKVIKSKALYGRIDIELNLGPLSLKDCSQFLPHKNKLEILNYYLTFGGIPKYWTLIEANKSYQQNIEKLFLQKEGFLYNDYEKIFYSQFKEHKTYEKITGLLSTGPLSLDEISKGLKKESGGSIKEYLDNLRLAGFIQSYVPFDKQENSKLKKYKISDEYLRFYFKFIQANTKLISSNQNHHLLFDRIIKTKWDIWRGFAFENFCIQNAMLLADKLDFGHYVESFGPFFQRSDKAIPNSKKQGFQIDLVFKRSDKVISICEIKCTAKETTTAVIPELQRKRKLIRIPRGFNTEMCLISVSGADLALQQSEFFSQSISLDDLFN